MSSKREAHDTTSIVTKLRSCTVTGEEIEKKVGKAFLVPLGKAFVQVQDGPPRPTSGSASTSGGALQVHGSGGVKGRVRPPVPGSPKAVHARSRSPRLQASGDACSVSEVCCVVAGRSGRAQTVRDDSPSPGRTAGLALSPGTSVLVARRQEDCNLNFVESPCLLNLLCLCCLCCVWVS